MAFEITNTSNQNFPTNPYRSTLQRSKTTNMGKFFHMNWGWGPQYSADPAALEENAAGWYRSVFEVDYDQNLSVLLVIK